MPHMRRIDCPEAKAEGLIDGHPYDTQLVSINGVAFHIWLGDKTPTRAALQRLERIARYNRDVVYMTFSDGQPTGFWAQQDMETPAHLRETA